MKRIFKRILSAIISVSLVLILIVPVSASELSGYGNETVVRIVNFGSGKYLNVGLGYDTNGNNIYQYTNDSSVEQKFRLRYSAQYDCYYIAAMCSSDGYDKGLDVSSVTAGANARLYTITESSTSRQRWYIMYCGNGKYTISPYANRNLYLTAHNSSNGSRTRTALSGSSASGNVYTAAPRGEESSPSNYQYWTISAVTRTDYPSQGYYKIRNVKSGKYITRDSGNNIVQMSENNSMMQTWFLSGGQNHYIPYAADSYSIYSFACYGPTNGATFSYDDMLGNCFMFVRNDGENTYRIATLDSSYGYVATVFLGSTEDGASIVQTTYVGNDSQKWVLVPVVENDTYYFQNRGTSELMTIDEDDAPNNYLTENATIGTENPCGFDQQKWTVTRLSNGMSKIVSVKSGKALAISTSTPSASTALVQQTYTGATNQMWHIYETGGYVYIKTWLSPNMYLSKGLDTSAGLQLTSNGSINASKWIISKTDSNNKISGVAPPDFHNTVPYDTELFLENVTAFSDYTGFTNETYTGTNRNYVRRMMTNSEIISITAHGCATEISLSATSAITVSDLAELGSTGLSGCSLCVYLSCNTGCEVASGNNIVEQTLAAGAGCVIGWTTSINVAECEIWSIAFFEKLKYGYTIDESVDWALNGLAGYYNTEQLSMTENTILVLGERMQYFVDL